MGLVTNQCSGECPKGSYSLAGTGKTSPCTRCAAGKFGETTGLTNEKCSGVCLAGTYATGGNTACTKCEKGSFGTSANATSETEGCSQCYGGSFSDAKGSVSCKSCAAGKHRSDAGADKESDCITCNAGEYSRPGASECAPCLPGKKIETTSSTSSACGGKCETGKYRDVGDTCKPCAKGSFFILIQLDI